MKKSTILFTVILLFIMKINLFSATVTTTYPTLGDDEVPIVPVIKLSTSKDVYMPEIKHFSPIDSSEQTHNPQIFLIVSDYYSDYADSVHAVISERIFIDTLDPRTLSINPVEPLDFEVDYSIVIKNLPLKDDSDGSVTYVDTTFDVHFTTISDSPKLVGFSPFINDGIINCKDTIVVNFSGPLDTNIVSVDSLFTFKRVTGYYEDTVAIDSILIKETIENVQLEHQIDSTKRKISFYSSSALSSDEFYMMTYEVSRLGIDTSYNYSSSFYVRPSSYIRTVSICHDSTVTIPDSLQPSIGDKYFNLESGDTVEVKVNDNNPYLRFSHWESEEFSYINNSTDILIKLYVDCENYTYLSDIYAVYVEPCIDTIKISFDIQDSIESVEVYGYLDSLGGDMYTISELDSNKIRLFINSKSNYLLDECVLHDSIEVLTVVDNIVDLDFHKFFLPCDTLYEISFNMLGPDDNCDELKVCVSISDKDLDIVPQIDQILNVTGITFTGSSDHKTGCVTYTTPPDQRTFALDAYIVGSYEECYEIVEIVASNGFRKGVYYGDEAFSEIEEDFELDADGMCTIDIDILVSPKKYILEVHHKLENNRFLPHNVDANFEIRKIDANGKFIKSEKIYDIGSTVNLVDYVEYYEYSCGTEANYHPLVKNTRMFDFGSWLKPSDFDPADNKVEFQIETDLPLRDELTFTMDDDKKIYYEYESADFYAVELYVTEPDDITSKVYSFDGSPSDKDLIPRQYPIVGMPVDISSITNGDTYPTQQLPKTTSDVGWYKMVRNYHRKTTRVGVLFSDAVDKNSLVTKYDEGFGGMFGMDDGLLSPNSINMYRPDLFFKTVYDGAIDGTRGGSIELITSDFVEFTFAMEYKQTAPQDDIYFYAPHMNVLNFVIGENISRLSDGEKIANPTEDRRIRIKTRNPGLYVHFESYSRFEFDVWKILDGDNCLGSGDPDVYYHSYASLAKHNITSGQISELSQHKVGEKSENIENDVENLDKVAIDKKLLQVFKLENNTYPIIGINFVDQGNETDAYNAITTSIATVAGQIFDAYVASEGGEFLGADGKILKPGKIIELGLKHLFKATICDDVPMGHLDWVGTPVLNWGPNNKQGFLYTAGTSSNNDPIYTDYPYRALKVFRHKRLGGRIYWILGDF